MRMRTLEGLRFVADVSDLAGGPVFATGGEGQLRELRFHQLKDAVGRDYLAAHLDGGYLPQIAGPLRDLERTAREARTVVLGVVLSGGARVVRGGSA